MNYSEIVDPSNNNKYSIFSKQGKHLLRKYIKTYKLGGSDSSGDASAGSATKGDNTNLVDSTDGAGEPANLEFISLADYIREAKKLLKNNEEIPEEIPEEILHQSIDILNNNLDRFPKLNDTTKKEKFMLQEPAYDIINIYYFKHPEKTHEMTEELKRSMNSIRAEIDRQQKEREKNRDRWM